MNGNRWSSFTADERKTLLAALTIAIEPDWVSAADKHKAVALLMELARLKPTAE